MDTLQLFNKLNSLGLQVRRLTGDRLQVVGDQSKIDKELQVALIANREVFLDLLPPALVDSQTKPINLQPVQLGKEVYNFAIWDGKERLKSPIAIDTETERIEGLQIPRLALVSVSDGQLHRLIHPRDIDAFMASHCDAHFVAHNAAFDFAVVRAVLRDRSIWDAIADQGRLHCTMLLDCLIRLGRTDELSGNRDLGTVTEAYLKLSIDKNDPYRLRYSELLDQPWEQADPGFFAYAIKDAIVTRKLWDVLTAIASKIVKPFSGDMIPGAVDRFGLLTESLQVRAAIALSQIEREGVSLDRHRIKTTRDQLVAEVKQVIDRVQQLPEAIGLFKISGAGDVIQTPTGKPSINQSHLREVLERVAQELELVNVPRTEKTGTISCTSKYWGQYTDRSTFLSLWVRLEELTKLCQFVLGLSANRIHPRYTVTVRTGRTSCSGPNIQQLPRAVGFREMIVPTKDHIFLSIDYSAIELRTLAAVCERRFGQSRLADIIREGTDPHAFTAAMFEGISPEKFDEHPDRKMLRQRAKALNFGIPGGLGAESLVAYAAATYGVTLSVDQAATFRDRLIEEVYPELKQYLQSDSIAALAASLQTSPIRIQHHFATDGTVGAIRRVIAGLGRADNGGQYGEAFVNQIWRSLGELNENPRHRDSFAKREISEQLADDLFMGPVVTATGRVRGRVGYSQSKNTPFQGLAADGAKLALWRLYLAGFRTVAFVHDEMLIELPVTADHTELARQVEQILCEAMGELTGDVPIACEYALADRWSKNAERVVDSDGRLQLWQPQ